MRLEAAINFVAEYGPWARYESVQNTKNDTVIFNEQLSFA